MSNENEYLEKCVNINVTELNEEMARVPADLSFWGERFADSLRTWKLAKLQREKIEALLNLEVREVLQAAGGKKPTEREIDATVTKNAQYLEAKEAEIESEANHLRLKGRFLAVDAKKSLLQSLGSQLRAEMESNPLTRERVTTAKEQAQVDDDGWEEDDF